MSIDIPNFEPPVENKKNPIYCAALEYFDRNGQLAKCDAVYTHAPDWATANASFRQTYSRELCAGRVRIVEVARAIGWFVDDNHGEQLSG